MIKEEKSKAIELVYPRDLADLTVLYVNHVQMAVGPEEVTLDLCQLQPPITDNADKAPARVLARVIMGTNHARRLAQALATTFEEYDKVISSSGRSE